MPMANAVALVWKDTDNTDGAARNGEEKPRIGRSHESMNKHQKIAVLGETANTFRRQLLLFTYSVVGCCGGSSRIQSVTN